MAHPHSYNGHMFEELSYDIIGACMLVHRAMGLHCMEVDYQRALELALARKGAEFQREMEISVSFEGFVVTKRRVDFVTWRDGVEILLETKARSKVLAEDIEQCLLYLHQGQYRTCLLVNFGEKPLGIKRLVHTPPPRSEQ